MWANQQLAKKKKVTQSTANVFQESKVFQQTMFLYVYSKLYTKKPRRQICLTQAVILSSTNNFTSEPQVKNVLSLHVTFLFFACIIHSNGPLRKHRPSSLGSKVTSVGCNWLILIHVVCFDYDWQLTFSECIVIFL